MNEDRFDLYYEFLGQEKSEALKEAIDDIILGSKWFPKIADIKEKLHPTLSKEEQYIRYLESNTKRVLSSLDIANREIEYEKSKAEITTGKEEAKDILKSISDKQDEDRDLRFQERKKFLEAQKKIVLGNA
jgi:hypothetical protein